MEKLEKMEPSELLRELLRLGYVLKSAGRGIHVIDRYTSKNDPEIKRIIRNRTDDLLEYMDKTYPNELLEEILTGLSKVDNYPPIIKKRIFEEIAEQLNGHITEAESCDSPIEFEFLQYLKIATEGFNSANKKHFWVHNQYSIVANGNKYRVDFLICEVGTEGNTDLLQLVIECDGHDFHEKTKLQAQRDKKRDRDLQLAGYRVLRFTGSEIFKEPRKCANEVAAFLENFSW